MEGISMLIKRKISLALAFLSLFALAGNAMADPGDVGTPAIDFDLPILGGGNYILSHQLGQVVMVFTVGYS